VARRRHDTTLLDLLSAVSDATGDDARTVGLVAELIREGRAFDSRGNALQLASGRAPNLPRSRPGLPGSPLAGEHR